jgi:C-terminal processing protease CtpA/Prc
VRLKQFSANAVTEMRTKIQKLEAQGTQGYILDLRSNPGGLFYGAIDIASAADPQYVKARQLLRAEIAAIAGPKPG